MPALMLGYANRLGRISLGFTSLVSSSAVFAVAKHPASDRLYMNTEDFDMPERVARKREEDLGPGDRVAFTQEVICPGALWNFRFSNEVGMVPFENARQFFSAIDAYRPKWIVVAEKGAARSALDARMRDWEYLGPSTAIDTTVVFQRRAPSR